MDAQAEIHPPVSRAKAPRRPPFSPQYQRELVRIAAAPCQKRHVPMAICSKMQREGHALVRSLRIHTTRRGVTFSNVVDHVCITLEGKKLAQQWAEDVVPAAIRVAADLSEEMPDVPTEIALQLPVLAKCGAARADASVA